MEQAETQPSLVRYYERRAGEYEAIYAKPERQRDLSLLKKKIPARLRGQDRVLKNFPSEAELRLSLPDMRYEALEYYWLAEYELK